MGPNWLAYLIRALAAVPTIVAGIESIHGSNVAGATKKQMAMEALGLASAVAPAIDPQHQSAIEAATMLASQTIDGTVAVMNAAGGKKIAPLQPPSALPAPGSTGAVTAPAEAPAPAQPGPASLPDKQVWP